MSSSLISKAPTDLQKPLKEWFRLDFNPETRKEVEDLINAGDWKELHAKFDTRIKFGTAGLRSTMEAGSSRMNTLTIHQATQGLAAYMKKHFPNNMVAVIGHDHRFHSLEFAKTTISVFLKAGFKVHSLNPKDKFTHTPLVPYAVDQYHAACGVMITASHNPKQYNGYKVYNGNGCQIIPPFDTGIAQSIDENLELWDGSLEYDAIIKQGVASGQLVYSRDEMLKSYLGAVKKNLVKDVNVCTDYTKKNGNKPWFVYTPMQGVGYDIFKPIVLEAMGLKEDVDYVVVPQQKHPDPAFTTVSFPNPEEKGALDMGKATGDKYGIDFVVANDPDADRFSACIKDRKTGEWHQMTGNELGYLFGYYEFQQWNNQSADFKKSHPLAMCNSTVSSQMISQIAKDEGFHFEDSLTGFKWIGNKAIDMEKRNYYVAFGYEEAIGYMFPEMEHDKDGVSATVVFLQAYANWMTNEKSNPIEMVDILFKKYGVFREYNGYYRVPEPKITTQVFEDIRKSYHSKGMKSPEMIGSELKIVSFRDLTVGYQSDTKDHVPDLPVDPTAQMMTIKAEPTQGTAGEYVRFTCRGSGTEPKLKLYIEGCAKSIPRAKELAKLAWDVTRREWFKPENYGMTTTF